MNLIRGWSTDLPLGIEIVDSETGGDSSVLLGVHYTRTLRVIEFVCKTHMYTAVFYRLLLRMTCAHL